MPDPAARTRGVALGVVSACSYGLGPVLIKVALEDMSTWTLLLYRLLLAAGMLWALLALAGRLSETPRRAALWLGPLALGAVAYGGQMALFALALERVSASLVVILFHTAPIVVVAVMASTGREPLTRLRLLALGLGVGGVAVVATASGELRAEPLGIVLAVGSAIAYAAVVLGTNAYSARIAPLPLSVVLATGAAIGMVVVALLLAWLALGEHLSALQLAGGGLILAAALVAHRAAAEPVPGAALA